MTTWNKTDETHRLNTEKNKVTTKTHFVYLYIHAVILYHYISVVQ